MGESTPRGGGRRPVGSDCAAPSASEQPPPQKGFPRRRECGGHRNQVLLTGRLTAEPALRELPSGDRLVTWRVAVTRPEGERRPHHRVDAVTCVSFCPEVQSAARGWRIGELVHVEGSLRRRFWRSATGPVSVYEVEARRADRAGSAEGTTQKPA